MRTNVMIDDGIMEKAMAVSHSKTKKEVIEKALLEFIQNNARKDLSELRGKIKFADGYDHKALREGRNFDPS